MTAREVVKLLRKDGWFLVAQSGSHMQFKVTVSDHKGDLPKGTLNSILKQAGLK